MKLIPKYQKAGLIARRDNTNVDTPNPYDKLTYKFQYTPRQETLSSDTRPEFQREQGKKRAELEYKVYDRAKKEEEGLQHLNAFLEFTDYAGLASGAGSLATKGAKSLGKRLISKGPIGRIRDTNRAKAAFQEYMSPFGYQLFNTYDGKIPEVARYIKGYVFQGKDSPKYPWHIRRMEIEPERTKARQEALRLYMGKPTDNLYIKNADGTYRYNPDRIPKENIEYQRKVFQEAGKPSQEYLTTTLNGPKGTRPGNAGGVTTIIDDKGNFVIDDVWDLNPLKRFKWLPKPIREFEAGKLIGAKPFRVYDDEIGKVAQNVDNDLLYFVRGFSPEPISTPLTAEATKEFFDYDVLPRFRKLGNEIPTSPDKSWYTYTREVLPKGVTGQHWIHTGKIDISHRLPRDKAEAVKAHEFRHKLDKLNPLNDSQKDYLNKTYRVFNNTSIKHPGSNTLSERMATNTELRFKYFNELKGNLGRIPSVRELDEYIDNIPESTILDDISKVNGYGFDYTNSLLQTMNNNKGRLSSEEIFKGGKSWLKNIKTTMKAVPVLSPFLINNKQ